MANYSPRPGATGSSSSKQSYDAFATLATPSSSNSSSRSLTPSNPLRPQGSGSTASATQPGSDAFSSLLGPSFATASNSEKLSLAERQAAARKEQQVKTAKNAGAKQIDSAVWTGLDMLGQQSLASASHNVQAASPQANTDNAWLFDNIKPVNPEGSKPASYAAPDHLDDDWGLSDFASQTQSSTQQVRTATREKVHLFDALDDTDLLSDSFGESRAPPASGKQDTQAEDDILGELGKPVAPRRLSPPQPVSSAVRATPERTGSPPPHIIGQIVEMGFSLEQARLALASTDTGLDVQQALDTLLANGAGAEDQPVSPSDRPRRGLAELQDEDDDWEERRRESPRPQRPVPSRSESGTIPPSRIQRESQREPQPLASGDIQETADKLLAQATEIGLSVFSRANALWKDSREKVQKVYEERAAKAKPVNDGRPRWMIDQLSENGDRIQREHPTAGPADDGFRDDDDLRQESSRPPARQRDVHPDRAAKDRAPPTAAIRTANLFEDEPAIYVSPARRRPAPSRKTSHTTPSPAPARSPPTQKPQTPPLRARQAVSANASAIAASVAHKAKGTELFKLGQFANAEQAYSSALAALPSGHLLLVPLYNNRAVSRIKIGEHSGAIDDCTAALSIIGSNYHPAREAKVTREDEGSSVDLGDAFLKALRRRAEAYEGREKWDMALKDWEAIIACEWSAKMRNDAFTGISRCRKILSAEKDPSPRPRPRSTPAPRPVIRPAVSSTKQDFEAVKKLRQANQAQEQEEQMKASLKDSVDARLTAWKAKKETNVRALVASLETVLWPELGWQKVGLHELVTPNQVKVRYMKAIAKLHPDKINSSNTTVEQRMIANGVFVALNDAWLAFKQ